MHGNRNIKHKTDLDSRCRSLKQGRLQVVSYLSELPPTKHDPQSFAVDLTLFTVSKGNIFCYFFQIFITMHRLFVSASTFAAHRYGRV